MIQMYYIVHHNLLNCWRDVFFGFQNEKSENKKRLTIKSRKEISTNEVLMIRYTFYTFTHTHTKPRKRDLFFFHHLLS